MKKILKIVSAAILLCFGMAATASAASTSVSGGRIDTVTLSSGNTAYIYVPENKENWKGCNCYTYSCCIWQ